MSSLLCSPLLLLCTSQLYNKKHLLWPHVYGNTVCINSHLPTLQKTILKPRTQYSTDSFTALYHRISKSLFKLIWLDLSDDIWFCNPKISKKPLFMLIESARWRVSLYADIVVTAAFSGFVFCEIIWFLARIWPSTKLCTDCSLTQNKVLPFQNYSLSQQLMTCRGNDRKLIHTFTRTFSQRSCLSRHQRQARGNSRQALNVCG